MQFCRKFDWRLSCTKVSRHLSGTAPRTFTVSEVLNESSRYRMDVGLNRVSSPDDPGTGVLLRRPRPVEERPQHDDDEFHLPGVRRNSLGGRRLLVVVRTRQ